MKFTCGECGRRFSTTDDPAPGHVYRVRCRCGNAIVVQVDAGAQAKVSSLPPAGDEDTPAEPFPLPPPDDPFLRAAMSAPLREPVELAATPSAPRLARRDPDQAGLDGEPSSPGAHYPAWPETTRSRRLAGTRAFLLDAAVRLREGLASGTRQVVRRRRLVAAGAALLAVAFALGVWVGTSSAVSRWRAKGTASGAEARAGAGASRESAAAPAAASAPPAPASPPDRAPAPVPAAAPPAPAAAGARAAAQPGVDLALPQPPRRRSARAARPAPAGEPAAEAGTAGEPAREPAGTGDGKTAMVQPPEGTEAEAASEPTPAAPDRPPDADPKPAAGEPAQPGR